MGQVLQQGTATRPRTSQASISAALAAASVRFPGEDAGRSLAEMAQRDLDAALQLLADRAQYITGSTGAAIALRRSGKNDMLCRASAGSNAPELGALLSTEFGLSGESVRSRQLLRCDDAERDTRVNREACRELGIASVAVMPVVNDDEVLGVFELFSGKANAFGERDFTALRRLSEMVETAVKLARAAEQLPEPMDAPARSAAKAEIVETEDVTLETEAEFVADAVLPRERNQALPGMKEKPGGTELIRATPPTAPQVSTASAETNSEKSAAPRPLLWSIALHARPESRSEEPEQNRVPAMLRSLRKCEACGFPVSPERSLCVECEEKKWRGQLNASRADRPTAPSTVVAATVPAPAGEAPSPKVEARKPAEPAASESIVEAKEGPAATPEPASTAASNQTRAVKPDSEPELVLSAALEPSQSWVAAHKFVLLAVAAVGAAVAFFLLR